MFITILKKVNFINIYLGSQVSVYRTIGPLMFFARLYESTEELLQSAWRCSNVKFLVKVSLEHVD